MDAAELLAGDEPFVVDTSTWSRIRKLRAELAQQLLTAITDGRVFITPIVRLEILYSARTAAEFAQVDAELSTVRMLRNDRAAADAAMSAQRDLAERGADGYHRLPLADVLIAAAAADQGGLAVLHKDAHFDRLAEVLAFESVSLPVA